MPLLTIIIFYINCHCCERFASSSYFLLTKQRAEMDTKGRYKLVETPPSTKQLPTFPSSAMGAMSLSLIPQDTALDRHVLQALSSCESPVAESAVM